MRSIVERFNTEHQTEAGPAKRLWKEAHSFKTELEDMILLWHLWHAERTTCVLQGLTASRCPSITQIQVQQFQLASWACSFARLPSWPSEDRGKN